MSRAPARGFIPQEDIGKDALRRWHAEDFAPGGMLRRQHAASPAPADEAEEASAERRKAHAAGLQEGRKAGFAAGLAEGRKAAYAENYDAAKAEGHAEGQKAGHAEGFAAGEAEGQKAGREQGFAAGLAEGKKAAEAEAGRIARLAQGFGEALKGLDQQMADALLSLALEVAAQVSFAAVKADPESLLPVIREALAALPKGEGAAGPVVFLSPGDLEAAGGCLEAALAGSQARLEADPSLSAGDVRIASGPAGVDASLETRWQRVVAAIGAKPGGWLGRARASALPAGAAGAGGDAAARDPAAGLAATMPAAPGEGAAHG